MKNCVSHIVVIFKVGWGSKELQLFKYMYKILNTNVTF